MSAFKRFLILSLMLAAAVVVCGATLDLRAVQVSRPEEPRTIAETLQALEEQSPTAVPTDTPYPTETPTGSPEPAVSETSTPSPTATETSSPAPTDTAIPTNTPAQPILSVSAATNCYAGPSSKYGLVYTMRPGIIAFLVGKDTYDSYWIIAVPGYPGTVCWLSGQYALISGDTTNLPSPATPLPSNYTLSEPKNLRVSCTSKPYIDDDDEDASAWTVVFRWVNTEPNQTGMRVFRNGRQIATLRSHASSYVDYFIHYDRHHGARYGVQAFNGTAVSSIVSIELHDCD